MGSEKLRQYIAGDKQEKEGKQLKTSARSHVEKLLSKAKGMNIYLRGIGYQEREVVKIDDNELYNWVYQQCQTPILDSDGNISFDQDGEPLASLDREKWDSLTKTVIDEERLEQAVDDGWIDLSNLPESCYTRSTTRVITVDHKKINNA